MISQTFKKLLKPVFLSLSLLFVMDILDAQTSNNKLIKDEDDIKMTLISETTAWANRDSIAFLNAYADETISQQAYNNRDGSYGVANGFESVRNYIRQSIKTTPVKTYEPNVERSNWSIKILSPEWAWVNFTQKTTTVKNEIYTSYESRLMRKVAGNWKIAVLNAIWDYKNVGKKQ